MPVFTAPGWLAVGAAVAQAATPDLTVSSSVAVTPGASSPAVTVAALGPDPRIDAAWSPALRAGLAATAGWSWTARDRVTARWGVWRDQRLCDRCEDLGPVGVGPQLLGSTDLDLSARHLFALGDVGFLSAAATLTLPASRDALVCNVLLAAPGAGAAIDLPVRGAAVTVSVAARRPIWLQGAAPVGGCTTGDAPDVRSLAGPVAPTPWAGQRWGSANPVLSASTSLALRELEDLVPGVDRHLTSWLSASLAVARDGSSAPVSVPVSGPDPTVADSREPARVSVPWTLSAGWAFDRATSLTASLSNALPAVLADPGGTLRALPATTTVGLTLTTSTQPPEVR